MEFIQILIFSILILLFLNMVQNLKMLKSQAKLRLKEPLPLISILIPARNEERNIRKCISSFLKQSYPCLEIIVLDDNSTDRTFKIVKELSSRSGKMKIIKGKKLPPGWNGKNWACHQLSKIAKGGWFLFTDADTTHRPDSVFTAFATAKKSNYVFVTYIPGLIAETWSEKLYMPIIHFAFLVLLPFRLINYSGESRIPFGIGPFMFLNRDFYFACGGYEAIKREIIDDMALAKIVKKKGGKSLY